jgi:alpha-ribazole phosphatase/probable phosphoglycerate mutase
MVARRILLVRHTEVAVKFHRRCYGRLDVSLSHAGQRTACDLASQLARQPLTAVIHSGWKRASYLASRVALLRNLEPLADSRWRERDFGTWEGRSWHAIWRETGNAMDGLFTHPDSYRPGGGETTAELAERSIAAWHSLPGDGLIVVISHGGPIAAVRTALASAPLTEIVHYTVSTGSVVACERAT